MGILGKPSRAPCQHTGAAGFYLDKNWKVLLRPLRSTIAMRPSFFFAVAPCLLLAPQLSLRAEPDFPLTADSQPQPGIPKGAMIKDMHVADDRSIFPGTEREYQIYLPAGFDNTKPVPFMVFQDGAIYQAPVVFDNLIAKKDIPPLAGIFIKPGVVPAAGDHALPRFNRSHEYDSITDTYSRFLIEELLPAIEKKHGLKLSTDPNDTAIAGNSSGGICAFMVAWHRPDRFRRVFTGVGTYVGIRGADQLPVLVRKYEPRPIRVFLQSGTGDNNLYCGDWWMANQMMERSLAWNGYDVNHAWGEGGHNQKHASQIFPDAMRWLWRDWQTSREIKANPRGDAKWRGFEVVGDGEWEQAARLWRFVNDLPDRRKDQIALWERMTSSTDGTVFVSEPTNGLIVRIPANGEAGRFGPRIPNASGLSMQPDGNLCVTSWTSDRKSGQLADDAHRLITLDKDGTIVKSLECKGRLTNLATTSSGQWFVTGEPKTGGFSGVILGGPGILHLGRDGTFPQSSHNLSDGRSHGAAYLALTPDQSQIYASLPGEREVHLWKLPNGEDEPVHSQVFVRWEGEISPQRYERQRWGGICVDTNGWLYVATQSGVQVCDQCGRVNFIIKTPQIPSDVCFGGKDLSELFIACGDTIYKRRTKARGCISGQMAPIKPPPPKL